MITLTANGDFEKALKSYLDSNISETLTDKINSGVKTLTQCANFIIGEMRKKATGSCAVASDDEVYDLAVHFFEEDSIKGSDKTPAAVVKSKPLEEIVKPEPKQKKEVKDFQLEGQMSIFDL